MKTLWCVGLVLLLAVEAGAGEPRPIDRTPLTGKEKIPLSVLMAGEEAPNPLVCLAQMEAAMRAMEPWIIFYAQGSHVKNTEVAKEVRAAWDQWDAVKRDCWRTP